ncbi:MAG: chemotaxis protein CheA, partial [Pseudomonadota bacterium]
DIQKIDTLINMVGELVITQSMLGMLGRDFEITRLEKLRNGLGQLERHTRELQESVMQIRMLPISFTFSRFPRLVHDLGTKLNKKVELRMSGENTEVDKTVIEKIGDPLVHLVRNSLDHGIEAPEARLAAGKPETGRVNLNAYHRGGNIVIEVKDDGAGLNTERLVQKAMERGLIPQDAHLSDAEAHALIFLPGFSTAQLVSDVSGRGVGMDVVRRNIHELGGHVDIVSRLGQGTNFIIRLPLTLAILDGQTIAVGREIYIVPLVSIVESIQVRPEMVNLVAGKGETFKLRNEYLSIVRLHEVFDIPDAKAKHLTEGLLVVVEGEGCRCGLFIDDLHGQQQVVVKSLEHNYGRVEGISGATILGDGSVALILDIPGLIRLARGHPMIADTTPQGFANTRLPTAQYLTFSLAEEAYGVDILRVQEIRGWEAVTRLPNTPAYVKGVLNLRGAIVPVFDLRQRFDLPWQPYGKDTVVIVLRAVGHKGMRSIGVVVDGVSDVLNANPGDLRAAPDFGTKISTEFIAGLASQGDSMVMLLDVDKLLGARSDSHEAFATEPSEALSRITIS